MKTKTIKTPLMTAVPFGPSSCSSGLTPKSKLLRNLEAQYDFVPKYSHHGGKNTALRAGKPFPYNAQPFFSGAIAERCFCFLMSESLTSAETGGMSGVAVKACFQTDTMIIAPKLASKM